MNSLVLLIICVAILVAGYVCYGGWLCKQWGVGENKTETPAHTMEAGIAAVCMIFLALLFRTVGVLLCVTGTGLNRKERMFCVISYLPKATVQAAIGSVPMAMGLSCGKIVLSVAVLAILITAPLGAIGMDTTYQKLLKHTV